MYELPGVPQQARQSASSCFKIGSSVSHSLLEMEEKRGGAQPPTKCRYPANWLKERVQLGAQLVSSKAQQEDE